MYLSELSNNKALQEKLDAAIARWEEQKKIVQSRKSGQFYVVISGQQNSGKSTLGNALVGAFKDETFETGDRIITKQSKEHTSADGITYIDTPGFGTVDSADEKECRNAWSKADLILFLHSSLLGGKDQKDEIEMMKDMAKHISDPEKRVLLLCTKSAERTKSDLKLVLKDFSELGKEIFGKECKTIAVDSRDFIDANRTDDVDIDLAKQSCIPDIKTWIEKKRNLPSQEEVILEKERKALLKILNQASDEIMRQSDAVMKEMEEKQNELYDFWKKSKKMIQTNWNACASYCSDGKRRKASVSNKAKEKNTSVDDFFKDLGL